MFENQLSQLFNDIANNVNRIIPVTWKDLYFNVELKEGMEKFQKDVVILLRELDTEEELYDEITIETNIHMLDLMRVL